MKKSLRSRFSLIFIGLAIGPMLLTSMIIGPLGFRSLEEQSRLVQKDLVGHVSMEVKDYFGERSQELLFLDEVYALGMLHPDDQEDLLNIFLLDQRVYQEMILLGVDGQEIIRLSRDSVFNESDLGNRATSDDFLYPLEKKVIYFSSVRFDEELREPLITISIPLYDRYTGEVVSVLMADMRFKVIWDLLGETKFPGVSGDGIYILDQNRQVIAHQNPTIVIHKAIVNLPEGEYHTSEGLLGEDAIFTTNSFRLGEQEFTSVVEQPAKDVRKMAVDTLFIVIFIVLIVFALVTWLAVILARQIVMPIDLLAKSTQAIIAGDLSQRVDVVSQDEIGQFADAFNIMTEKLEKSLSSLESEVKDHKKARMELALSEARYRSIVEDSPGLLCGFLPDGEITFVNKSYAEYYSTTPEELVGTSFLKLLHEDDRARVMAEIHTLDQSKPSSSLWQRVYLPNGEIRHQRWVNRALFSAEGEVISYQAFGEDIQKEYQIQQMQSALYRIWQAANRVNNLSELYPSIHEIIQEIIPANNFIIALADDETQLLSPVYYVDEYDEMPIHAPNRRGPTAYVLEHVISLRCTPDELFSLDPTLTRDTVYGTIPKIWLGIPLILSGRAIGVMVVQDYHTESALGNYEQEFLEMLAPSVAATIARQKVEEEIQTYARSNALLFDAAQSISETLELDVLYRTLYRIIAKAMDCDFFMISSYDSGERSVSCEYLIQDSHVQDVSEFPVLPLNPNGDGTQSKVILSKKPIIIPNYLAQIKTSHAAYYIDDGGSLHDPKVKEFSERLTRSAIIAPLFFGGEITGIIQVMSYREDAYTAEDLHIVEALSNQIAIASNNARLYSQAQSEIALRREAEEELQKLNLQLEEHVKQRTIELHERISAVERLNTGMANILHDLNIANQLAEKNAHELSEANAELEAFSYSVSHDLRAPLRHIESFSQLLYKGLGDRLSEDEERYFKNIFTASHKMRNLIRDLLALSRASTVDFTLKQIDFNPMIESVRTELFDEIDGRNIDWTLVSLPSAYADPGLIKIVWTNLIGNAVKYTRLCETAKIEIGTVSPMDVGLSEDEQVFFVRDNGVGFDQAYSDKLFGVFQRLHQSEEFEGNGIGLATVRRIIARHGGKVWAEGVLNSGSTFYFSLPAPDKVS